MLWKRSIWKMPWLNPFSWNTDQYTYYYVHSPILCTNDGIVNREWVLFFFLFYNFASMFFSIRNRIYYIFGFRYFTYALIYNSKMIFLHLHLKWNTINYFYLYMYSIFKQTKTARKFYTCICTVNIDFSF